MRGGFARPSQWQSVLADWSFGKKPRPEFKQLATFLEDNRYPIGPEIVFWENESMLVKTGTNTEIKTWF